MQAVILFDLEGKQRYLTKSISINVRFLIDKGPFYIDLKTGPKAIITNEFEGTPDLTVKVNCENFLKVITNANIDLDNMRLMLSLGV